MSRGYVYDPFHDRGADGSAKDHPHRVRESERAQAQVLCRKGTRKSCDEVHRTYILPWSSVSGC